VLIACDNITSVKEIAVPHRTDLRDTASGSTAHQIARPAGLPSSIDMTANGAAARGRPAARTWTAEPSFTDLGGFARSGPPHRPTHRTDPGTESGMSSGVARRPKRRDNSAGQTRGLIW
jgi:hypothetical protein